MKLSLACALSHGARLLILDEATAGLDPMARDEVLDLLREFVADDGHGVLMSSHITSDLERIADRVVCIDDGRIVFDKPKDEITDTMGVARCRARDIDAILGADVFGGTAPRILRHEYGIRSGGAGSVRVRRGVPRHPLRPHDHRRLSAFHDQGGLTMIRAWHLDLMMIRQRMLLNLPISLVLCLWLGLQTQSPATVVAAALFMTYPMVGMQLGQYDELKGWKSYRMTLPLSRRDIVAGRYLTLLTLVIASLLTAAVAVGLNIGIAAVAPGLGGPAGMMAAMFSADAVHAALLVGLAFLLVCTVMVCAMTILFYRFGATTATTMLPMLGVFAVLMVALFVGSLDESVVAAWSDGLLWLLSPERLALCCGICAALTVAIMAASAAICLRIYTRTEL